MGSGGMEQGMPEGKASAQGAAAQTLPPPPPNSGCSLFTNMLREAHQQMAEAKHLDRQLKQCC